MISKSFGLLFYLKKPRSYTSGNRPIYMRITVDGIIKEISLRQAWDPTLWNAATGRPIGKKGIAQALSAYLDTLQAKVFEAKHYLLQTGQPITAEVIRNLVQGRKVSVPEERPRMLMEIFKHHNDQMAALVGREFAAGTLDRYRTSLSHTRYFLEWKFNAADIDIRKLDFEFITDYEFWLKSVRHCDHNTTLKYLCNFRKIVNRCIRNGWLSRDPFMGFNMTQKEVERAALTDHELQTVASKIFVSERLAQVRDIFLFCCTPDSLILTFRNCAGPKSLLG